VKAIARLTVADVMTRDVITVEPEQTLREVVDILADRGVSGAPVVAGARILGVISKSDLLEFLAATPAVPAARSFSEWGEIESAPEELEGDEEASAYYRDLWDDAGADTVERFAETDAPEWDLLSEYTASSIMTRRLETIEPDASIAAAALRFLEQRVHRLLVVKNGNLEGVVSMTDLVRMLARQATT
jgi:CBS domain-containing protein